MNLRMICWLSLLLVSPLSMGALMPQAWACSRVLWNANPGSVISGRTSDWFESLNDLLIVYPRGLVMDGGLDSNSATWTSKYGSLVSSIYPFASTQGFGIHDGATDGINEQGLAVHQLYLAATKYEARDQRPGVTSLRWVRYLLDNFGSVDEAVQGMQTLQVVPVALGGEIAGMHVALEDRSGDSAILEYVEGQLVLYHGKEYTVLTNDPVFTEQLTNMQKYKVGGGDLPLPGTIESTDRFVRAHYYLNHLPQPKDQNEAVTALHSVIRSVTVPFGAPYQGLAVDVPYPTWTIALCDVSHGVYYYQRVDQPNMIWVTFDQIDFSKNTSIRKLDPNNPALVGEVSGKFVVVEH